MTTLAPSADVAEPQAVASARPSHPVRPFVWSVRRELWEHRSIWAAPAIAAGVVLFGFLVSARRIAPLIRHIDPADPSHRAAASLIPSAITLMVILGVSAVVAILYCLGALHNERRDRSILFWKSLPVSDLTTVLAKAAIPLAVLPVIGLVLALVTEALIVLISSGIFAANGVSPTLLWDVSPIEQAGLLVWGVFALSLWHAPAYAWLMLVGAWAKRAPFLWAFGVPLAAVIFEEIAFGSSYVGGFFWRRLTGGLTEAFGMPSGHLSRVVLPHADLVGFFGNPGLWVGLVVAAAMFAGCVWLRRYREPS